MVNRQGVPTTGDLKEVNVGVGVPRMLPVRGVGARMRDRVVASAGDHHERAAILSAEVDLGFAERIEVSDGRLEDRHT